MGKPFTLEILTPKARVFEGTVTSLVAPGAFGYLGVLANHAPMVVTLAPGRITCRDEQDQSRSFESSGEGVLEVRDNKAVLLADAVSGPEGLR